MAAAFVVGAIAGAVLIGVDGNDPRLAAADIPERVRAAQRAITSLDATVDVVERGWHEEVPTRTYAGSWTYRAPESLVLQLRDTTAYPSPAWVPNDVAVVVDGSTLWTKGVRACPPESLPTCTPTEPAVEVLEGRDPFAAAKPIPLDLVTPVESLGRPGSAAVVEARTIAGHDTVGVTGTAAQFDALLSPLGMVGNLREFHPTDRVALWLEEATFIPLAVEVVPSDTVQRRRWAVARGYADEAGTPVLQLTVTEVSVNDPLPDGSFPPPPTGADRRAAGFADSAVTTSEVPFPTWLPDGFEPYRTGRVAGAAVRTWTDGRAWVRVDATRSWTGRRLFGQLGSLVRPVDLGAAGRGYASEDGSRVSIHGRGIDIAVRGSLAPEELVRVAASLGVRGAAVPDSWAEAATTTLAAARRSHPGLLVPTSLEGFSPPAVRVDGSLVSLAYAGAGARGLLITQADGAGLSPPLDADALGVVVRGRAGRYSPARGELEWMEGGRLVTMRSATLAVEELLAIAETLVAE